MNLLQDAIFKLIDWYGIANDSPKRAHGKTNMSKETEESVDSPEEKVQEPSFSPVLSPVAQPVSCSNTSEASECQNAQTEDAKKTENNKTDHLDLTLPEQLCDQRLETPDDDDEAGNYEDRVLTVSPPPFQFSNDFLSGSKLPLPPGLVGHTEPPSSFILELFRQGIDITDPEEKKKLIERLANSKNEEEKRSIETYIAILETKQCEYCDYSAKDRDTMKRHVTTVHLKDKPYTCDECDASFGRKDKLKRHKQCVHSDERPYVCDFCDHSCKRQDKMRLHTQRVHFKHEFPIHRPPAPFKRHKMDIPPTMVPAQSTVPQDLPIDESFEGNN